jgi:hypothetical protein
MFRSAVSGASYRLDHVTSELAPQIPDVDLDHVEASVSVV